MWLLLIIGILQSTTPNIYDLTPLVLIVLFIIAAAGLTKGGDIFQFFGVASLIGLTGGIGGGAGKGLKAANPTVRYKAAGQASAYGIAKKAAGTARQYGEAGLEKVAAAKSAKQTAILEMAGSAPGGATAVATGGAIAAAGAAGAVIGGAVVGGSKAGEPTASQNANAAVGARVRMAANVNTRQSRMLQRAGRRYENAQEKAANYEKYKGKYQAFRYGMAEKSFQMSRTPSGKIKRGTALKRGTVLLGSKFRTRYTQWRYSRLDAKAGKAAANLRNIAARDARRELEGKKGSTSSSALQLFALGKMGGASAMANLAMNPKQAREKGMSDSNIRKLRRVLNKSGGDSAEFTRAAAKAAYQSRYNPVDSKSPVNLTAKETLLGQKLAHFRERRAQRMANPDKHQSSKFSFYKGGENDTRRRIRSMQETHKEREDSYNVYNAGRRPKVKKSDRGAGEQQT